MSKRFKIGDTVALVSDNKKRGVIKDKFVKQISDNETKVTYLVKFGNSLNDYKEYTRKEIENLSFKKENNEVVSVYSTLETNNRKVIVCGVMKVVKDMPNIKMYISKHDEVLKDFSYTPDETEYTMITLGHAICNPEDVQDFETGYRIAYQRAMKRPFASFTMSNKCLSRETLETICEDNCHYVINNLKNFINNIY